MRRFWQFGLVPVLAFALALLLALPQSSASASLRKAEPDLDSLPGPWQSQQPSADFSPQSTASWCDTVLPPRKDEAEKADELMSGLADLGKYGYFRFKGKPAWKYRPSTLDSSGYGHMHGLYWAVPLLRVGLETGNSAMVARFYKIVNSWLDKYTKKKSKRPYAANVDIIEGERLWTYTCAVSYSGSKKLRERVVKEAKAQVKGFRITSGTNNVAIHGQTGAMSAFCALGRRTKAQTPRNNLLRLGNYLVLPDGSDREGSPLYVKYTRQLLQGGQRIQEKCYGSESSSLAASIRRSEGFLSLAARPDFWLETVGDTAEERMWQANFDSSSPAYYAASLGKHGTPPKRRFKAYKGGYVFGNDYSLAEPSHYSFRTTRGPSPTAHTHNDIGSVTFFAEGQRWLGDPGPYRYSSGHSLRRYMVSRSAHSGFQVTALKPRKKKKRKKWQAPRFRAGSQVLSKSSNSIRDVVCIREQSYSAAVKIKRCVRYDRASQELQVKDKVKARARIRIRQRWQVPPNVKVTREYQGARLRSGGRERSLTINRTDGSNWIHHRAKWGRAEGWFTGSYGERLKGSTLERKTRLSKGAKRTWITRVSVG